MVRAMAGHGCFSTRYPPPPRGTECPSSSTTSASIPGNGNVADPGFSGMTPGRGVMRMHPVSVCHHVSTMGHRPPPMYLQYQTQRSEEHTSELQSHHDLVCRLLLEKKKRE